MAVKHRQRVWPFSLVVFPLLALGVVLGWALLTRPASLGDAHEVSIGTAYHVTVWGLPPLAALAFSLRRRLPAPLAIAHAIACALITYALYVLAVIIAFWDACASVAESSCFS